VAIRFFTFVPLVDLIWSTVSIDFGIATEKGGGVVLRPNDKSDTDGQPYLTIPDTSQGFQNNF
jgi:hypothetical protein